MKYNEHQIPHALFGDTVLFFFSVQWFKKLLYLVITSDINYLPLNVGIQNAHRFLQIS